MQKSKIDKTHFEYDTAKNIRNQSNEKNRNSKSE